MPCSHSRREFIRRAGLGAAGVALAGGAIEGLHRPAAAQPRRPNVLFILTDDQRFDAMSCVGHPPWLQTPNMDRIRNEGVLFRNAFVTISLCSPSRASFLTGCYAHTHNVRTNEGNDPDPALPTFPAVLQAAGYATAYIGKWHMAPTAQPRPGFDYWLSFLGQGKYIDPDLNENGRDFRQEGYMTDLLTDYALDWLQQPRDRPFCLCLAHKAVHGPFTPAERHKDQYKGEQFPEPPNFRDTFEDKPEWIRAGFVRGARREAMVEHRDKPVPPRIEPTQWDPASEGRRDYYRTLSAVDEGIGRVLGQLEQTGELDNTIVIFAGDNGYFHGEHRRGDKRLMYEESLRIPLLMRYPALAQPGRTVEEMVLNIDVAPTLLELTGTPVPHQMQGASVASVLRGDRQAWRDSFLYEYFQEGWLPGIPTMLGVRTQRYKYITYPKIDDIDEMYDLQTDPNEMTNLAVDPRFDDRKRELKAELSRLLKETGYAEAPRPNVQRPGKAVLLYRFDDENAEQVTDASGQGNHGRLIGTQLVEGRRGKARRFAGTDYISVPKSLSLDPARGPIAVEAWVKPESPSGVILARGGQSHGYCLSLREGRPVFTLRLGGEAVSAIGSAKLGDDWTHLAAVLTSHAALALYVNGEPVATTEAPGFISIDPNEGLEIGMDRATLVAATGPDNGLVGLIDEIIVYNGERTQQQVREAYAGP